MNQMVSYRVVEIVAGNSEAVTLSGLKADTQYQLTVAAVWQGKKYRSRPIVFRTLGEYKIHFILNFNLTKICRENGAKWATVSPLASIN